MSSTGVSQTAVCFGLGALLFKLSLFDFAD